jgi:hypothetical protein
MPSALINTRNPFESYWTLPFTLNNQVVAFITNDTSLTMLHPTNTVDPEGYTITRAPQVEFLDMTLSPNRLYFYYIRTVRTVDGVTSYSTWSDISVTTYPVQAPINLRIERTKILDRMRHVVFSFDAAIGDLNALGRDVTLWYELREDGQEWSPSVQMDNDRLRRSATELDSDGYRRFEYQVTGLRPGTGYFVRVYALDSNNDKSLYSNLAQFRTDTDQEEYDYERETDDWLRYLRNEMEKLLRNPYWITRQTNTMLEVLYRPDMIDTLIRNTATGNFILLDNASLSDSAISTASARSVYYLPSSVVNTAARAEKGFTIRHGGVELFLSPSAVNEYSRAIIDARTRISNRTIADYYLRLTVSNAPYSANIDGQAPISDLFEIQADIVELSRLNRQIDQETVQDLAQLMLDFISDKETRERVEAMVRRNTNDAEMVRFMQGFVQEFAGQAGIMAGNSLGRSMRGAIPITSFDRPTFVQINPPADNHAVIYGHKRHGGTTFTPMAIMDFNNKKAIRTNDVGVYIFTAMANLITQQSGVTNFNTIAGLVSRHRLTDFLGETSQSSDLMSRGAVIGTFARVAGSDARDFLAAAQWLNRQGGLDLNTRRFEDAMSVQEAIYAAVGVYAAVNRIDIGRVIIRDHNALNNVQGILPRYNTALKVAFELGIYTDRRMDLNKAITFGEFCDLLNGLVEKAKIR